MLTVSWVCFAPPGNVVMAALLTCTSDGALPSRGCSSRLAPPRIPLTDPTNSSVVGSGDSNASCAVAVTISGALIGVGAFSSKVCGLCPAAGLLCTCRKAGNVVVTPKLGPG